MITMEKEDKTIRSDYIQFPVRVLRDAKAIELNRRQVSGAIVSIELNPNPDIKPSVKICYELAIIDQIKDSKSADNPEQLDLQISAATDSETLELDLDADNFVVPLPEDILNYDEAYEIINEQVNQMMKEIVGEELQ